MEIYNPKDWIKAIFSFNKSDTLRKLWPLLIGIGLYSVAIAYIEQNYFDISSKENTWVKSIPIMHSLLGFVISMLLVFRTNTAYDRWWEGRKQWGELVNNSRNLSLKLNAMLNPNNKHSRNFFQKAIPLYAKTLKHHLRSENTRLMLEDHSEAFPDRPIDVNKHLPNQVANMLFQHVGELYRKEQINNEQWLILNNELSAFTNICGACERIKNTPIPYSYSSFIKKFLVLYVMSLPFGYIAMLGYWVALVVMLVAYVLLSLEVIAEEIEDPFGNDPNDLPMEVMASNIKKHIEEIFNQP